MAGAVMATTLEVGVALGVGVGAMVEIAVPVGVAVAGKVGVGDAAGVALMVGVAVGAIVGVAVLEGVAVLVGVGVEGLVGVGVAPPFCTVTLIEAVPSSVLFAEYAVAEMVCRPLGTVVESQLKVDGGVEAK